MQTLIAGQNKAGRPETDKAALTALSACLLCFVPIISACISECVFVAATNSTNQTNKGSLKETRQP
jgi:hypothetical protein